MILGRFVELIEIELKKFGIVFFFKIVILLCFFYCIIILVFEI